MSGSLGERRPISRRLMAVLFLLMMVPTAGWYFLGDLTSRDLWGALPEADQSALREIQDEVRLKLALTLAASVAVLGGVIVYVRRTILDPLDRLARRARRAGREPWSPPEELDSPDEVGDLARALDRTVRELEGRAEEAVRFATNLGHELHTPLAAIRGAAEILADPDLSPQDRSRFVGHVAAESERIERLVEGLLDLARAEGRRAAPVIEPLALPDLVRGIADRCGPLLERSGLRMETDLAESTPRVRAEGDRVARVLLALVENAIKFSPPGAAIRVGVKPAGMGGGARVEVDDGGPGVPPALRERVFDRCFTTDREGGPVRRGPGSVLPSRAVSWKVWGAGSGSRKRQAAGPASGSRCRRGGTRREPGSPRKRGQE